MRSEDSRQSILNFIFDAKLRFALLAERSEIWKNNPLAILPERVNKYLFD